MKKKINKKTLIPNLILLGAIFTLLYLAIFGGQFCVANRIRSKAHNIDALIRIEELHALNDALDKEIDDMDHTVKVQKRKSAEIGYKDPNEQIIKKTRKKEILP
jgi:cell division protein FtsB